jgi:GT2 family glycosyltransferase
MTGIVIPTLGSPHLMRCLEAVAALDPAPERTVVVVSGGATVPEKPESIEVLTVEERLGFAAAVNAGIYALGSGIERIALLNDDAVPAPEWLGTLEAGLDTDPALGGVQGTVTDALGTAIDGRGISFDNVALPVQVDRGSQPAPEPAQPRAVIAVSGTASLYRTDALRQSALADGSILDPRFGSYHEDLDLGLRLRRLGWRAAWVPGAWVSHTGSATGSDLGWRHPWWILTNRWRAVAGNLTAKAVVAALPVLLRGELRAVRTLGRTNPRAMPTAAAALACLPWIVIRSLGRPSPGPRLTAIPESG